MIQIKILTQKKRNIVSEIESNKFNCFVYFFVMCSFLIVVICMMGNDVMLLILKEKIGVVADF